MINNLTGLRFYLAFWVAVYHLPGLIDVDFLNPVIHKGYLAVDVFFVLSGYILTHVYYKFFTTPLAPGAMKRFIIKRFTKIYPLHFFTLLGAIVYYNVLNLVVSPPKDLAYEQIPQQLLLIHSWGTLDQVTWNFPSWSISAEWFAYILVFPLAFLLYRRFGFKVFAFIVFGGILTFYSYTNVFYNGSVVSQMGFGLARVSAEFLLGVFAYLFFKNFDTLSTSSKRLTYWLWAGATLSVLWFNPAHFDYYFILLIPLIFYTLHGSKAKILRAVFANRTAIFLGEVSFSLYMTHFFAMRILGILNNNFFGYGSNNVASIIAYFSMLIGFAVIAYYLIEQPCRKWTMALFTKNYLKGFLAKLSLNASKPS